jgi:hypothetical protein
MESLDAKLPDGIASYDSTDSTGSLAGDDEWTGSGEAPAIPTRFLGAEVIGVLGGGPPRILEGESISFSVEGMEAEFKTEFCESIDCGMANVFTQFDSLLSV